MCHKTAGFTTSCLSLWCHRCLWRVSSSRSCCDKFHTRGIFGQKGLDICCFSTLISVSSYFIRQFMGKMKSGCRELRGKREGRNFSLRPCKSLLALIIDVSSVVGTPWRCGVQTARGGKRSVHRLAYCCSCCWWFGRVIIIRCVVRVIIVTEYCL